MLLPANLLRHVAVALDALAARLDGKAFRPDGATAATLLPAAFGLAGVNLHTYTGWGSVTHWNAFVANLEMMGSGTFYDPRLNDATKFPLAARAGFGNVRKTPDQITAKLAARPCAKSSIHWRALAIAIRRASRRLALIGVLCAGVWMMPLTEAGTGLVQGTGHRRSPRSRTPC